MSKAQKTLYGIIAFLPIIMGIFLVIEIFSSISEFIPSSAYDKPNPKAVFDALMPFFGLALIAGLLSLTNIILYIVHVVNNKNVTSNERTMWILLFIFVNGISEPIYFLIRIVNEKPKEEGTIPKM